MTDTITVYWRPADDGPLYAEATPGCLPVEPWSTWTNIDYLWHIFGGLVTFLMFAFLYRLREGDLKQRE